MRRGRLEDRCSECRLLVTVTVCCLAVDWLVFAVRVGQPYWQRQSSLVPTAPLRFEGRRVDGGKRSRGGMGRRQEGVSRRFDGRLVQDSCRGVRQCGAGRRHRQHGTVRKNESEVRDTTAYCSCGCAAAAQATRINRASGRSTMWIVRGSCRAIRCMDGEENGSRTVLTVIWCCRSNSAYSTNSESNVRVVGPQLRFTTGPANAANASDANKQRTTSLSHPGRRMRGAGHECGQHSLPQHIRAVREMDASGRSGVTINHPTSPTSSSHSTLCLTRSSSTCRLSEHGGSLTSSPSQL